jgi:hypothetical protein
VDHGASFTDIASYELTYVDASRYFGGDVPTATVVATTHVAHHGGLPDAPLTTSFGSTLERSASLEYRGSFAVNLAGETGDSQTDLDHLGVAFSVGSKWDSNLSRNYDL